MSAGAVEAMVRALGSEFEKASGHAIDYIFNTAGSIRDRIKGGEAADLVILPPAGIDVLEKADMIAPGTRTDLARTVTGICVRQGAPVPDISTPDTFRQTLLKARSVGFTDPKAGGSGGNFFNALLDKLGLADAVRPKAVYGNRGVEVARAVAEGRAEIGTTFISEILTVKGVNLVGPLPGDLHNVNTYTAAILAGAAAPDAAKALLRALTAPETACLWVAAGLEPAFRT